MATLGSVIGRGVTGSRPAAASAGRLYFDTTLSTMYRDNGSSWDSVEGAGGYVPGGTDVAIADGGTGQSTATLGFDALSPMTTAGDLIVGGASGTRTRLAAGATSGHVLTSNGASTAPSWQAAAGGGGSDLVQTNSGAGSIYVPGLRGSPDAKPASPSAYDDEFDALSGWTTWGTLDSLSAAGSLLFMSKSGSGNEINGIYKACPSLPFTVTIHIPDGYQFANYDVAGLFVTDATPASAVTFVRLFNSGYRLERDTYSNRTTRTSATDLGAKTFLPPFLRMLVTSSSSITYSYSWGGLSFETVATINPGFTAANVGVMLGPFGGGSTTTTYVDWIRFS